MRRGEIARRGRLVAFFALLAVVCVAAPVLAETPAEEGEATPPLELQRDEALETPQAVAEREGSEYAYADLTAGQEAGLLQESFAQQLGAIDADPARALADVTIERLDSPTEALVTLDGEKVLLESEVPLRAPEEDGDLHKVELGLEETPEGFEPANPLVALTLPDSAQAPIGIGDEGLAITPVGAAASAATPIGDEDLLLPAVHDDTSLLLSPIAGGLELSAMLASRNSPEQLSFDVALPQGTSLRGSEAGGAEVVDAGGNPVATITAPHAVDAQGTEVPATLAVEGSSLSIVVPHRELDVAYPLFVDPEIIENWSGFADTSKLGYWHWSWSGVAGAEDYIGRTSCIVTCWGNGLYVRARSSFSYPAGSWGRWWFTPQGSTTYMKRVILGPINYDAHGCTANEPHGYVGVWNDNGSWVVRNNAFPSGWATSVDAPNLPVGSRTAFVGIHAESGANLNCGRDYRLGGATLYLDDPEQPTVSAASGYPTGWVKSGQTFTINAPASDPGLGVYSATLSPGGSPPVEKKQGCDGHYYSACPGSYAFQFPIGAASFDEGEKPVRFSATDALGKGSNTYSWNMKVDRTPPEIELAGQLAQATDETEGDGKDDKDKPLPLPVYNLTVNATDGVLNPTEGGQKRSGVKKIQVFIDNRGNPEQTWEASSCAAGNCPLSKVFVLKLNELSADTDHYLRILATDFAGNAPRERKLEFEYIPATGIKDEYVMQYFPLPDGSGNEAEEEHPSRPELAVNLVSGNLVYRQQNLDVPGAAADLELELFYNSLLPGQQDTEWGDGWTLSQTPQLEIEGGGDEATIVDESAMVESKVDLPAAVGEEEFDKRLQATVTKEPGGSYAMTDESGETGETVSFDSAGKAEELSNGTAATVEYDYEGGDLSGIAIDDPGTANVDPESIEEGEPGPPLGFLHSTNLGSYGSEDGQLKAPGDVATDAQGNLWILDANNGRVQKFGPDGQFLAKWGTPGTAEGQLNNPSAIAIDGAGNVLVADSFRVQKFSPSGQLLAKFGSIGSGNGQFFAPTGLAVAGDGSIWVSDISRVQRFSAAGQFIERIGASGPGEIGGPEGLATAPNGDVLAVDRIADRVKVYNSEGDYVRQFGSSGTGPGQFSQPVEISVDSEGQVWVADEQTDNVQAFSADGDYLAGFGGTGSGAEQLDLKPRTGIAVDRGRVWVADGGNHRLDEWVGGTYEPSNEPVLAEDDPQLDVDVSEGLVESVEGEESGTIEYAHSGDLLTAVDAPAGEAQFSYDGAGHMTKATLPNGTYGEIAYEATYGRVKSVTVAVEGKNPKTTYFSWSDEPRRTTVTPPDAPATTYDIAADGSIFKWWNAKQPPVLDDVAGTLWDNRETSTPIATGTHNLVIQAHDDEGVASIQVIANNNQMVDERTCDFDPEKPTECVTETNEWVTETANWPPGIVYLEVIATDRLGEATSQRFWVNIPYTPPPDPEAEEPPRFNDILNFREKFGLDLDLKGDELAVDDRVFELMGDWHNPNTPAGEVARTTMSRWGVPMRAVDLAELEYRQRYTQQVASAIPAWANANAPSTYAGYYVDHRAGGVIRVGFTQNNQATVASLVGAGVLEAGDRVSAFSQTPSHSYQQLIETQFAIANAGSQLPSLTTVSINAEKNLVEVGTTATTQEMSNAITGLLGASAPVEVFVDPSPPSGNATTRERIKERVRAGERIFREKEGKTFECTAGFGAWLQSPSEQGGVLEKHFLITAAHCGDMDTLGLGTLFERRRYVNKVEYSYAPLGHVRRSGITDQPQVDAAAIFLEGPANGWAPREIFQNSEYPQPITGATVPVQGMIVCTSGATTNKVERGVVLGDPVPFDYDKQPIYNSYEVPVDIYERQGDSGAPVWECGKGNAVGLWNAGTKPSYVTALLPIAVDSSWNAVFGPLAPGALAKLGFQAGNLSTAP